MKKVYKLNLSQVDLFQYNLKKIKVIIFKNVAFILIYSLSQNQYRSTFVSFFFNHPQFFFRASHAIPFVVLLVYNLLSQLTRQAKKRITGKMAEVTENSQDCKLTQLIRKHLGMLRQFTVMSDSNRLHQYFSLNKQLFQVKTKKTASGYFCKIMSYTCLQ